MNKLLKAGGPGAALAGPKAKVAHKRASPKASPIKKKMLTPRRNKKLRKAAEILERLKGNNLPGLEFPLELKTQNLGSQRYPLNYPDVGYWVHEFGGRLHCN